MYTTCFGTDDFLCNLKQFWELSVILYQECVCFVYIIHLNFRFLFHIGHCKGIAEYMNGLICTICSVHGTVLCNCIWWVLDNLSTHLAEYSKEESSYKNVWSIPILTGMEVQDTEAAFDPKYDYSGSRRAVYASKMRCVKVELCQYACYSMKTHMYSGSIHIVKLWCSRVHKITNRPITDTSLSVI